MGSSSWRASGATAARRSSARRSGPRPAGSWDAAIARARESWDGLTGGPRRDLGPDTSGLPLGSVVDSDRLPHRYGYSDVAAAAILRAAAVLWADTAATMGGEDDGPTDDA